MALRLTITPITPLPPPVPRSYFASLRHQEQAEHEAYRRNSDRVDQSISDTARCRVCRRGDEWHQSAAPAVADHVRHGYRRVADPGGEKFGQERADRPVDHPNIGDENGDDEDRNRMLILPGCVTDPSHVYSG